MPVTGVQTCALPIYTAGETEDAFAPVEAQYVRLVVDKPAQGTDSAARIYEMEVYGLEGKLQEDLRNLLF